MTTEKKKLKINAKRLHSSIQDPTVKSPSTPTENFHSNPTHTQHNTFGNPTRPKTNFHTPSVVPLPATPQIEHVSYEEDEVIIHVPGYSSQPTKKPDHQPTTKEDLEVLVTPVFNGLYNAEGWLTKGIILLIIVCLALALAYSSHKIHDVQRSMDLHFSYHHKQDSYSEGNQYRKPRYEFPNDPGPTGSGDYQSNSSDYNILETQQSEFPKEYEHPVIEAERKKYETQTLIKYGFPHSETTNNKFPSDGVTMDITDNELQNISSVSICCVIADVSVKCSSDVSIAIGSVPYAISHSMNLSGFCTLSIWINN